MQRYNKITIENKSFLQKLSMSFISFFKKKSEPRAFVKNVKPKAKPNTKRLKRRDYEIVRSRYGLIEPDEEWYQIPRFKNYYVSQYARVVSLARGSIDMLTPTFIPGEGYYNVHLYRNGKRKFIRLHELVAMVWVPDPDFVLANEKLEVHHLYKVKNFVRKQRYDINWACNLMYVYKPYHDKMDDIVKMRYRTKNGKWHYVKRPEDIAKHFGLPSSFFIYEMLLDKPINMEGNEYIRTREYLYEDGRKEIITIKTTEIKDRKGRRRRQLW